MTGNAIDLWSIMLNLYHALWEQLCNIFTQFGAIIQFLLNLHRILQNSQLNVGGADEILDSVFIKLLSREMLHTVYNLRLPSASQPVSDISCYSA